MSLLTRALSKNQTYRRWWIVVACICFVNISSSPYVYGFGALFDPIQKELGWGAAAIALAFSLRTEVGAIASPLVGVLQDRFGARIILVVGLALMSGGFLLLRSVHDLTMFFLASLVIAIANSFTNPQVSVVTVSWWFTRNRAKALSVLMAGTGLGGLAAPVVAWLVSSYGWRDALLVLAVVAVGVGLPLAFPAGGRPRMAGVISPSNPDKTQRSGREEASAEEGGGVPSGATIKEALAQRTFWVLVGVFALANLGTSTALALLIPALTLEGISSQTAALAVGAIPVMSVPARLVFGWLGDQKDKRLLLAACFTMQAVGLLILSVATGPLWLIPFILLFGPAFGGPVPLRPAMQADYFGVKAMGGIQGLFSAGASMGAFVGPVLAGLIADLTGSYRPAWVLLAATVLLAVPLLSMLPATNRLPAPSPAGS